MSKRHGKTDRIELVETHNLALAIQRLNQVPYDSGRWRRALYHALGIVDCPGRTMMENIRKALELP